MGGDARLFKMQGQNSTSTKFHFCSLHRLQSLDTQMMKCGKFDSGDDDHNNFTFLATGGANFGKNLIFTKYCTSDLAPPVAKIQII